MRPGTGRHDHIKTEVSRRVGYKIRKLVTHAKIPAKVPLKSVSLPAKFENPCAPGRPDMEVGSSLRRIWIISGGKAESKVAPSCSFIG